MAAGRIPGGVWLVMTVALVILILLWLSRVTGLWEDLVLSNRV